MTAMTQERKALLPQWLRTPAVKQALTLGVTVALCGLVFLIDPAGLGRGGQVTLALFLVAAMFWMTEVVPLYVTSLILLAGEIVFLVPALEHEGLAVSKGVFMAPFFSDIILLFLGGLLLAQAGSKYRIDTWFAGQILKRVGGEPSRVLLGMMFTGALLSMWMSNTATTAMMLIIAVAMTRDLPEEAIRFKKALFLGIPFACNIGGMGTPIGTPPNAISLTMLKSRGVSLGFLDWMLASLPLVVILLLILWRVLLRIFPPPEQPLEQGKPPAFPQRWQARLTMGIFGVTVLCWLTGGWHGLSTGVVALLATIALLSTKVLDSADFRGISWDVLYLVGGGLSLGVAIKVSGLAIWLTQRLSLDSLGFVALLITFVLVGMVLTTFMSNTATANMLMPIALSLPTEHVPVLVGIAAAVSSSMALPVSTPPNAIAYYSGEIELGEMFRVGALISVIASVLIIIAGLTYWDWIGLY